MCYVDKGVGKMFTSLLDLDTNQTGVDNVGVWNILPTWDTHLFFTSIASSCCLCWLTASTPGLFTYFTELLLLSCTFYRFKLFFNKHKRAVDNCGNGQKKSRTLKKVRLTDGPRYVLYPTIWLCSLFTRSSNFGSFESFRATLRHAWITVV